MNEVALCMVKNQTLCTYKHDKREEYYAMIKELNSTKFPFCNITKHMKSLLSYLDLANSVNIDTKLSDMNIVDMKNEILLGTYEFGLLHLPRDYT